MRRPRTWVKLSSSPGRTSNERTAGLEFQSSGKQDGAKDRTRTTTVEHTADDNKHSAENTPTTEWCQHASPSACRRLDPAVQRPARCPGARQTYKRRHTCPRGQRGAVHRSAARASLVFRWTT